MLQKMNMNDLQFGIRGMGRIDENTPIDFKNYTVPYPKEKKKVGVPVVLIPKTITVSKQIGRIVYDVTASFDTEGKKSVLQQFKELILSADSQN